VLAAIARASDAVPVPPALTAPKVTVLVPALKGVPEISPVLVLRDNPEGSPVAV
jgi:hypothetical protein